MFVNNPTVLSNDIHDLQWSNLIHRDLQICGFICKPPPKSDTSFTVLSD